MSYFDKINGPKVVGEILNSMGAVDRKRILERLQEQHPDLLAKIEDYLSDFDDICKIAPKGVQVLVRNVEHEDLVLSLKTASAKVREALFEGMSDRKRELTAADLEDLPPTPLSRVEEGKRVILQKLDELRSAGLVQTKDDDDVWV